MTDAKVTTATEWECPRCGYRMLLLPRAAEPVCPEDGAVLVRTGRTWRATTTADPPPDIGSHDVVGARDQWGRPWRLDVLEEFQHFYEADGAFAQRIDVLYRDLDRADAASRELLYLHIGKLLGIVLRLTDTDRLP